MSQHLKNNRFRILLIDYYLSAIKIDTNHRGSITYIWLCHDKKDYEISVFIILKLSTYEQNNLFASSPKIVTLKII